MFYTTQFTIFMRPKNFSQHFPVTCSSQTNPIYYYLCHFIHYMTPHFRNKAEPPVSVLGQAWLYVQFITVCYWVPLHYNRTYIMKHVVSLPLTLILTKVHNCTVFIRIQHLAASNYCSASYLTFMMHHFKFSVDVLCIVIFVHILFINVYFLSQYAVH
jgi:hypothetical protein